MNALTFHNPRALITGTPLPGSFAKRSGEQPRSDRRRFENPLRETARSRYLKRLGVATQNGRPPCQPYLLWATLLLLLVVGICGLAGCRELDAATSPCCRPCQPTLAPLGEWSSYDDPGGAHRQSSAIERSILVRCEEGGSCH